MIFRYKQSSGITWLHGLQMHEFSVGVSYGSVNYIICAAKWMFWDVLA